ncbi:phosphate/phosphite/phosphonate ABC transporter substrate-binding protein [Desulfotomaculum varum]
MLKKYCWFTLFLFIAVAVAGCGSRTRYIDFTQREAYEQPDQVESNSARPLRIALASVISPKDTIVYYRQLASYLSARLSRPVALIQRRTYEEVNMLLSNGEVDIAFASTGSYCSYRGITEIEILAMVDYQGSSQYKALVIVPADSQAAKIEDLEGKTFAFTDPLSNSGRMIILKYLLDNHKDPAAFFKRYVYTYNHDKSLWAVANKLVDGASIDSMIYEYASMKNPQEVKKVKIIASFGPFPTGPVVIRKNLDPLLKSQIRQVFFELHHDRALKPSLNGLLINRFVSPQPQLYEPLIKIYNRAG